MNVSRRPERLASLLRTEITQIIMREIADPRIRFTPSITRVKVSDDLAFADVYVSMMGTPGEQSAGMHALQHSAGMIRSKLAKFINLRTTPAIRFHVDEALKKELEMLELLHKLEVERKAREPQVEPAQLEGDPTDAVAPADPATKTLEGVTESQPENQESETTDDPSGRSTGHGSTADKLTPHESVGHESVADESAGDDSAKST